MTSPKVTRRKKEQADGTEPMRVVPDPAPVRPAAGGVPVADGIGAARDSLVSTLRERAEADYSQATVKPELYSSDAKTVAPVTTAVTRLGSFGVRSIDQHDALFLAASDAVQRKKGVRVNPRVTKAMMGVESGNNGDYPVTQCRGSDGYPGPRSCGPMQIKWPYHEQRCPECNEDTLAGHIELATHIIGDTMKANRCDEYEAYVRGYLTSNDINGTTQQAAVARLKQSVAAMEKDAGGTPAPAPVETDPYRVICGGAYPAVTYGWLTDAGLNYYGYGVNHGTQRATQHTGDDIPLAANSPLYAPAPGIVDCVGEAGTPRWGQSCGAYKDVDGGGVGNITILLDGGVKLTLGHCRQAFVRPGERVVAGQKVGTVGSMNGPHVHVETSILKNGSYFLVTPKPTLAGLLSPAPVAIPLTVRKAIADDAGSNRPRTPIDGNDLWITVHETANTKRGATALMHREFVNDGGGVDRVSFHFAVDDREAIQILPLDEIGYHAGDGCDSKPQDTGCFRSVAIETCVNFPVGSAEWEKTLDNLSALLALLVTDPGRFVGGAGKRFSFDRIAPHNRWSGKNCPQRMLAGNLLPGVIVEARALAGGYTPAPPARKYGDLPIPDVVFEALFLDPTVPADPTGAFTKYLAVNRVFTPVHKLIRDGSTSYLVTGAGLLRAKDGKVEVVK